MPHMAKKGTRKNHKNIFWKFFNIFGKLYKEQRLKKWPANAFNCSSALSSNSLN